MENGTNATNTTGNTGTEYNYVVLPPVVILMCVTFGLNILVIVCVKWEKKLQKINNMYITSLAVADCVVGFPVMSGMLIHTYHGYWPYGEVTCIIWMSIDFPTCTISMLHLCLIGFDRYNAIVHPLAHRAGHNARRAKIYITIAWFTGILAWVPAIISIRVLGDPTTSCLIDPPKLYVLLQSIIVYYTPIFAMLFFYARCLKALHLRGRQVVGSTMGPGEASTLNDTKTMISDPEDVPSQSTSKLTPHNPEAAPGQVKTVSVAVWQNDPTKESRLPTAPGAHGDSPREQGDGEKSKADGPNATDIPRESRDQGQPEGMEVDDQEITKGSDSKENAQLSREQGQPEANKTKGQDTSQNAQASNGQAQGSDTDTNRNKETVLSVTTVPQPGQAASLGQGVGMSKAFAQQRLKSRRRQHQRGVRTLGAVILVFLLCWLPVCVIWPISAYCVDCVPSWLFEFTYWSAYVNSTLNPMLYFICNRDYREALIKLCRHVCRCCVQIQPGN